MTLLRGYCPTCNGPLWRTEEDAEPAQSYTMPRGGACRLCWIAALPTWCAYMDCRPYDEQDSDPGDPLMESWRDLDIDRSLAFNAWRGWMWSRIGGVDEPDRIDEANSTENTAATSTWLPRVWVCARTERRELGERGTVVWFRQTDEPDALATDTLLAQSLLVEELGHPSYPSVAP